MPREKSTPTPTWGGGWGLPLWRVNATELSMSVFMPALANFMQAFLHKPPHTPAHILGHIFTSRAGQHDSSVNPEATDFITGKEVT